jgi:hypothetical protein
MVKSTQVVSSEREMEHQTEATQFNATCLDFQEIIIRQFIQNPLEHSNSTEFLYHISVTSY